MTLSSGRKTLLSLCALLLISAPAWSRGSTIMPAPQKAPRVPVSKQALPAPALKGTSSVVKGQAKVLSGDLLQIGQTQMRLFGLASTNTHSAIENQARVLLENLAQGTVTCQLQRLGKPFLASCENAEGKDLAQELLRRGLAVTQRGALHESNLALTYISAEESAKAQQLALWKELPKQPQRVQTASADTMNVKPVFSSSQTLPQEKPVLAPMSTTVPATIVNLGSQQGFPEKQNIAAIEELSLEEQETASQEAPAQKETATEPVTAPAQQSSNQASFVERYQFLLTGFMLLLAAMVASGSFVFIRMKERREELQAIAAAMRGELMSMRAICLARLAKMAHDTDGKVTSWPRFRTFIFKAHVSQIGRLGADLARQVSSIYGQASDYASYYMSAHEKPEQASKKQAMQTLVSHIEEVAPRLAAIENSGLPPHAMAPSKLISSILARALPPKTKKPSPPLPPKGGHKASLPAPQKKKETTQKPQARLTKAKEEREPRLKEAAHAAPQEPAESEESIMADAPESKPVLAPSVEKLRRKQAKGRRLTGFAAQQANLHKKEEAEKPEKEAQAEAPAAQETPPPQEEIAEVEGQIISKDTAREVLSSKTEKTVEINQKPAQTKAAVPSKNWTADIKESVFESLAAVQSFASSQFDRFRRSPSSSIEDIIPDYANLTEEELETLAYEDADLFYEEEYEEDLQKTA